MPFPSWVRRFTRRPNRGFTPLAPYLPGFGVMVHTGRKTGRQYRTPVKLFGRRDGYLIAVMYGRESDWVRNVLSTGRCTFATGGRLFQMTQPCLVGTGGDRSLPALVRLFGRVGLARDFLDLTIGYRTGRPD